MADAEEAAHRGTLTIRDRVVTRIACTEALSVDGVRTGEASYAGRMRTHPLPRAFAVVDGAAAAVTVHIATDWPAPLPELGRTVQARIAGRIRTLTGLEPTRVDVTVDRVVPWLGAHAAPQQDRVR